MITEKYLLKASVVLLIFLTGAFADANIVGNHNLGLGAGFVTGYGLSYRQWFNRNGIQATFTPYYDKSKEYSEFVMSLGVTGLFKIKEAKYVNLLLYYGPHFWYSTHTYRYYSNYYPNAESTTNTRKMFFIGGGPGFDFHFWKISFNLMFGLAFRTDFNDNSGINFTGETALYYSF
jgi:hypothetical protein